MYNDTTNAESCECVAGYQCTQVNCDCSGFCQLYIEDVKTWEKPIALTISPNPKEYSSIDNLYKDWKEKFIKFSKHFSKIIIVAEMANQLHFHIVGVISDEYGYTKHKFKLSLFHNIKQHGMFKHKLHYLFKDVAKTYKRIKNNPILEKGDLTPCPKRPMARTSDDVRALDLPVTPKWMLQGGYESE